MVCNSTGCGTFVGSDCVFAIVCAIRENQSRRDRSSRSVTGQAGARRHVSLQYDVYVHVTSYESYVGDGAPVLKIFAIVCCSAARGT